jgi:hypothetical protein
LATEVKEYGCARIWEKKRSNEPKVKEIVRRPHSMRWLHDLRHGYGSDPSFLLRNCTNVRYIMKESLAVS